MKVTYENIVAVALEMQTQNWQELRSLKLPTDQAIKLVKLFNEIKQKAQEFENLRQGVLETAENKQEAVVELLRTEVELTSDPIVLPNDIPFGIVEVLLPFVEG